MTMEIRATSTRDQLLGSWHLLLWSIQDAESEIYPLGRDAIGQLMYDETGRVSAQLVRQRQQRFAEDDWQQASTEEKAAAWGNYFGYFGTYTIDEDGHEVIHHVEGSWFPNLAGSDEHRHYRLEDNHLFLDADTAWGHVKIVWEKIDKSLNPVWPERDAEKAAGAMLV